jgi:hypothetical protein
MDSLPDEILLRILRTLPSDPLILYRIAQVNRKFKRYNQKKSPKQLLLMHLNKGTKPLCRSPSFLSNC